MSDSEKKLFEETTINEADYTKKSKKKFKDKAKGFKYHQNYAIIVILCIISLVFLPMLGSEGDITFNLPQTPAGILIWVLSKVAVIILNLLIFGQFIKQAKVNVREHPLYLEAERLLNLIGNIDDTLYYHPEVYINKMKKQKRITVLVTSTLSIFGFGHAILNFDWLTLLTYLFTVITSVVFGWITMLDTEDIWTFTYIKYARQEYKKFQEKQLTEQFLEKEEFDDKLNESEYNTKEHTTASTEE